MMNQKHQQEWQLKIQRARENIKQYKDSDLYLMHDVIADEIEQRATKRKLGQSELPLEIQELQNEIDQLMKDLDRLRQ